MAALGPDVRRGSWPAARARTGLRRGGVTGEGRIRGRRVAVVACEFAFLAGSIGVRRRRAAGRRASSGPRPSGCRCWRRRPPGGTRMQEGTLAFLQMVKITAAMAAHKAAGLPYLVYLRHPTTGGVLASWGSLGHVTAAEPGALIGFLGPRVYEALYGDDVPGGRADRREPASPTAWSTPSSAAGGSPEIPTGRSTSWRTARGPPDVPEPEPDERIEPTCPAWESVRRSRRPDRPGVRAAARAGAPDVVPMQRHRRGRDRPRAAPRAGPLRCGPRVVLGQDRSRQSRRAAARARPGSARRGAACARRRAEACRWSP